MLSPAKGGAGAILNVGFVDRVQLVGEVIVLLDQEVRGYPKLPSLLANPIPITKLCLGKNSCPGSQRDIIPIEGLESGSSVVCCWGVFFLQEQGETRPTTNLLFARCDF